MKNKKLVIILTSMMVLIGGILYVNQIYNKSKNKHIPKRNNLAIMIKEDGATDYTKSNSKDIPKGDYTLNYEKSYCKNNGVIGDYDSTLGKVSFSFVGTDSCFLYFDYKATYLYDTIEERYNEDKTFIGLYTGEDSETYKNKVYYYKDNVENNNVLFAGFCWKIVRTTETGGVKLIYNGVPKEEYSSYEKIEKSDYTIISNDATYPYVFDETNKVWKSNNTDDSGAGNENTFDFSVKTNGAYYLDISINNESGDDYMELYLNNDYIGYGENCGDGCFYLNDSDGVQLNLTSSDIIKVIYYKGSTTTDGTDYVQFNLQKGVDPVMNCNKTGTDSQIGTSAFNSNFNSPAYVGYMYNNVYAYSSKTIINSLYSVGLTAYGDGVTYASSKYTLTNATTLSVTSSNISNLVGKYTCNMALTTDSCGNAYYIVGYSGNYIYGYSLFGGTTDGTTLANKNYVFGSSFTYANGTYTLSDTTTINSDTFITNKSNVDTHHYTCLSSGTTCTSLYYVYFIYQGTPYYITLTGGKSLDDALNEMLYNDDVNKKNSTIKTYIDNWYANNMTSYTEKLEDTVFCNDRSMSNKTSNGWYPNGGSTSTYLSFKYDSIPTTPSLKCTNENDKFTVSTSNGNGALTYPVGLLTVSEAKLANYGNSNYLNSGQYVLLASPNYFVNYAMVSEVRSSGFTSGSVNDSGGVRPVISLKPKISISSGDGSFTNPFMIN